MDSEIKQMCQQKITTVMLVTLVHGTWGRRKLPGSGPLWFEEGSSFAVALKQALAPHADVAIDAFLWSGANSLNERADAAAGLAHYLQNQRTRSKDALQIVVGHSHGGSVALLSLRYLDASHRVLLITLATPFVEIATKTLEELSALSKRLARDAGFASAAILMIGGIYKYLADVRLPGYELNPLQGKALIWTALASAQLINVAQHVYGVGKVPETDKNSDLAWTTPPPHRPEYYQMLTIGGLTIDPPRNALIIRGVDDEAGMALAVGSIAARVTALTIALTKFGTRIGLAIIVPVFALLLFPRFWELWLSTNIKEVISIADRALYPLLSLITGFIFLPLLSGIFKSVYGRELLFGGYYCDIKSASAPDIAGSIYDCYLSTSKRKGHATRYLPSRTDSARN